MNTIRHLVHLTIRLKRINKTGWYGSVEMEAIANEYITHRTQQTTEIGMSTSAAAAAATTEKKNVSIFAISRHVRAGVTTRSMYV